MTGQSTSLAASGAAARGRKRKNIRTDQPLQPAQPAKAQAAPKAERPAGIPAGWRVIASKEFADHITSVRFLVLTVILTLAAGAAVYSTAGLLKSVAPSASGAQSLFLYLFFYAPQNSPGLTFVFFISLLAPLLGIAFGFDGVNGERSEGTLPRLVSQPIHRDDVINGKFVAGLAAISVILIAIVAVVGAIGVLQLGILPSIDEVLRLAVWVIIAIAYVGLWLAAALLCSVVFKRAATSALVAIGIWLVLTTFAGFLVGIFANYISPNDGSVDGQIAYYTTARNLSLLSPSALFTEATKATLNPSIHSFDINTLISQANVAQADPLSQLSLEQSLIIVWPQFVGLIALTSGAFAVAYVNFMRQEVRA